MIREKHILKQAITIALGLFTYLAQSQESPIIKYFEAGTIHEVKIDFDNDGDIDFIVAGVIPERHQGRVYLIENKGTKLAKPEYIYSFPTIPVKIQLDIQQKENITTINVFGTSPEGEQTKYTATLYKGEFAGLLIPPITGNSGQ